MYQSHYPSSQIDFLGQMPETTTVRIVRQDTDVRLSRAAWYVQGVPGFMIESREARPATSRPGSHRIRCASSRPTTTKCWSIKPFANELGANVVRVDSDFSAAHSKAKIAYEEQSRVQTMLAIGGRDMEAGAASVRLHHDGPQGAKPKRKSWRTFWPASRRAGRDSFCRRLAALQLVQAEIARGVGRRRGELIFATAARRVGGSQIPCHGRH
jgi:hypothetical protein